MRQLHRCLGYQKDQAGNLIPDKNAELVRQIFQMAADGWSISQITKYLNENKITTQNDMTFSRSTVSRILHNHAYKGCLLYTSRAEALEKWAATIIRRQNWMS